MSEDKPAILGGAPISDEVIPITKPTLPKFSEIQPGLKSVYESGMLTNAENVKKFEQGAGELLGVSNVVAVSSCSAGLMLTQRIMKLQGEVILPSFTFSATGHTLRWNGLTPVFADIAENTYNLDPEKVKESITSKTSAILGVHMFGVPCDVRALGEIAADHKIKFIIDAAHAFGSKLDGKPVGGFGDAEVFSASPTKLMTTGEGGLVSTNDQELAEQLRIGRNYGDDGSYDCAFPGFNARMGEWNAVLGIESLRFIKENVKKRNELVVHYKKELEKLPGISFQKIPENCTTTFKDFSLFIDAGKFGMSRDKLHDSLLKENIVTKKYFYPPLHRQVAYREYFGDHDKQLTVTNKIADNSLSLPLYSHMTMEEIDLVVRAVTRIHEYRGDIK